MHRILTLASVLFFLIINNLNAQNNISRKGTMKVRKIYSVEEKSKEPVKTAVENKVKDEIKNNPEVQKAKADIERARKEAEAKAEGDARIKARQDSIKRKAGNLPE
jgi:hypothetical protein